MTLFDIITASRKRFPSAEAKDICHIVNELEERLRNEIFLPHSINCRREPLDEKKDINKSLILEKENFNLYIYFIYAVLSIKELDFECSNAYTTLFNEGFKELAILTRRNNIPTKNIRLTGGV